MKIIIFLVTALITQSAVALPKLPFSVVVDNIPWLIEPSQTAVNKWNLALGSEVLIQLDDYDEPNIIIAPGECLPGYKTQTFIFVDKTDRFVGGVISVCPSLKLLSPSAQARRIAHELGHILGLPDSKGSCIMNNYSLAWFCPNEIKQAKWLILKQEELWTHQ